MFKWHQNHSSFNQNKTLEKIIFMFCQWFSLLMWNISIGIMCIDGYCIDCFNKLSPRWISYLFGFFLLFVFEPLDTWNEMIQKTIQLIFRFSFFIASNLNIYLYFNWSALSGFCLRLFFNPRITLDRFWNINFDFSQVKFLPFLCKWILS